MVEVAKGSGVNLDELQQETEKLLALLKERQTELISWHMWHMLLKERLKSHHALTGKALDFSPIYSGNIFPVTVNHELSRKEAIALGKYDAVNDDITEEHFPRDKREFPIVALGSVWQYGDGRRVPCLSGRGGRRRLGLGWFEGGWDGSYSFLAVRES